MSFQLYTFVAQCEKELLETFQDDLKCAKLSVRQLREISREAEKAASRTTLKLQGSNKLIDTIRGVAMKWCGDGLSGYVMSKAVEKTMTDEVIMEIVNLFETVPLIMSMISTATTTKAFIVSLVASLKMLAPKPLLISAFEYGPMIESWIRQIWSDATIALKMQAFPETEDFSLSNAILEMLKVARACITGAKEIAETQAVRKFRELLEYLLTFGCCQSLGLTFDACFYSEAQSKKVRKNHMNKGKFIFCLLDTVIWTMERMMQAVAMKSFSPFYHSSATYSSWLDTAHRLIEDDQKLTNPEVVGINVSQFVGTLRETIESGEAMYKFALQGSEKTTMGMILSKLRLIEAQRMTVDAARKPRRAPDSILVFGSSGVAKSKFSEILFIYYAQLKGLDASLTKRYTRCYSDKFYSSYYPDMWCVQLDDIALQNPGMGVMDPSLSDVIQIVNNVTFVPPQAELDSKGKIPMLCDLVIATTNSENLNAHSYFSCPLAVQRRLKTIVQIEPKVEFQTLNDQGTPTGMIDPSKIPFTPAGEFPNVWNIYLKTVFAENVSHSNVGNAKIVEIAKFEEIEEFLAWWGASLRVAEANQQKDLAATSAMASVRICQTCMRTTSGCTCPSIQAASEQPWVNMEYEVWAYQNRPSLWLELMLTRIRRGERIELGDAGKIFSRDWQAYDVSAELLAQVAESRQAFDAFIALQCEVTINDEVIENTWKNPSMWVRLENGIFKHCTVDALSYYLFSSSCFLFKRGSDLIVRVIPNALQSIEYVVEDAVETVQKLSCVIATSTQKGIKAVYDAGIQSIVERSILAPAVYCYEKAKEVLTSMGQRVACLLNDPKIAIFLGVLAAAIPLYKGISYLTQTSEQADIAKDERPNAWVAQDEFRICAMDVGSRSLGLRSQGKEAARTRVELNTISIAVYCESGEVRRGKAICLKGHIYMTNCHILTPENSNDCATEMEVVDSEYNGVGPKSGIRFQLDPTMCKKSEEHDLCFFYCPLPPKSGLQGMFAKQSLEGGSYNGFLTRRDDIGKVEHVAAMSIKRARHGLGFSHLTRNAWLYKPETSTVAGDCGSPLCAETNLGTIVLGIHQTYQTLTKVASAISVSEEMVSKILASFEYVVQGSAPDLGGKNVGRLHWKSVMYELQGNAKVYGSFNASEWRQGPRTHVTKAITCDAALEEGFELKHTAPTMKGKEPWKIATEPCTLIAGKMKHAIIDECVNGYIDDVWSELKETHYTAELSSLTTDEAVNGLPGVRFIDKMNRQTSMGFPYKKSKKYFLLPLETADPGYNGTAVQFTEDVVKEIKHIENCYANGQQYCPIFSGSLKDEPVTFKKAKMGKTRVFAVGPAAWSVVVRKNLLPFIRVMQCKSELFECAVGINPNSIQWQFLREYLTRFGENRMIAGDYGNYDKRMYGYLITSAFKIIREICKRCNVDQRQLNAIACIAEDTAYAWYDFQGDIVQFFGSNPSGHPLTVIINCLVNSIYMRYCYYNLNPAKDVSTFKKNVALVTYGDDNAMGVSPSVPWFNHTTIQSELAKIDVVYTMADKEAESVPYISIDDVSFLKRKWRFDEDAQIWLAPLEWDSINKMLTVCTASDSVTPQEQAVSTLTNCALEMFHYGKAKFESNMATLRRIVINSGIAWAFEGDEFLSWDEYVEKHHRASLGFVSPRK